MQTAVLADAVCTLKVSAAHDDSELIRGMNRVQSISSRMATSGAMTNNAPSVAGR